MSDHTPDFHEVRDAYISWPPATFTEKRAAAFDRFIADVKADAWDEGLQAGWEECQNPDPFVNDWWDSKTPNPHRVEGEA